MVYGVIDCPDCNKQVSARAIVCIHCGGPLLQGQGQQRLSTPSSTLPTPTSVGDMADHAAPSEAPADPPQEADAGSPVERIWSGLRDLLCIPSEKKEPKSLEWFLALILSPIGIGLLLMFFLGLRSGGKD